MEQSTAKRMDSINKKIHIMTIEENKIKEKICMYAPSWWLVNNKYYDDWRKSKRSTDELQETLRRIKREEKEWDTVMGEEK